LNDFDAVNGRLRIDESAATWGIKETKTPGSVAWVSLPAEIKVELARWLAARDCDSPSAFIFPNARGGPIGTDGFRQHHLWPAAVRAGIVSARPADWPKGKQWADRATSVNFQAFRRTCATWFQKCGTSKDIQTHLRHASPNTTLGVYVQAMPESVRVAVEALDQMIRTAGGEAGGAVSGSVQ
jgi:integrase